MLSEDILCHVLGYVSLYQRVKFERINKEWKSVLSGLWFNQKRLVLVDPTGTADYANKSIESCLIEEHCFREIDVIEVRHRNDWLNFVRRCPNLKAIHCNVQTVSMEELALVLNQVCPRLAHVDISKPQSFYTNFSPGQYLTCLLTKSYSIDSDAINTFFKTNSNKLTGIEVVKCPSRCLEFMVPNNLKKIVSHWSEQNKLSTYSNLTSVGNFLFLTHKSDFLNCTQLVEFYVNANVFQCEADLRTVLLNNKNLKSITISQVISNCAIQQQHYLRLISSLTPNLKTLRLYELDSNQFVQEDYESISKLTKLRELVMWQPYRRDDIESISDTFLDGFKLILSKCVKLRNLKVFVQVLGYEPLVSFCELIGQYANEHPNRWIYVNLLKNSQIFDGDGYNKECTSQLPINVQLCF